MSVRSLSVHIEICPFESNSMLTVNKIPVQSTLRYLEHSHKGKVEMSWIFQDPLSLNLGGYTATEEKCSHSVLMYMY